MGLGEPALAPLGLAEGIAALGGEPVFTAILERAGPPRFRRRRNGFETLLHIILEQQVSIDAAAAMFRRLNEECRPLAPAGFLKLDEATLVELNCAWYRLDAWPDVGPGFARLRARLRLCPCSNGSIAIMAELGRRNDLRWHAVLGSEIAHDFKPNPRAYLASAEALNLKPSQCMMVAAHSRDLIAAAKQGLRTGHVGRPGEGGPGTGESEPLGKFDVAGKDFVDFAAKMGT